MTTPSTKPSLKIAAILGGALILSILPLFWLRSPEEPSRSPKLDTNLDRFKEQLSKDLDRSGCDPTRAALVGYQLQTGACKKEYFHYGLIQNPTLRDCKTKLGELGILSYQGLDVNRDGVFFPEEGLNMRAPSLRPPAPKGIKPLPPKPLPEDFYNDYIVYAFDEKARTIERKNLGSLSTTQGDSSRVVLKNVISFQVEFEEGTPMANLTPDEGTFFDRVSIHVLTHEEHPEPGYENPRLGIDSPYRHHRTAERNLFYQTADFTGCSMQAQ